MAVLAPQASRKTMDTADTETPALAATCPIVTREAGPERAHVLCGLVAFPRLVDNQDEVLVAFRRVELHGDVGRMGRAELEFGARYLGLAVVGQLV